MTAPKVTITALDGGLGVLPPSAGIPLVVMGPADSGPFETPAAFTRQQAVISNYTGGPLVEWSSFFLSNYGLPVIPIRTHASTAGVNGTLVPTMTGTSVPSFDAATHSNDDYDLLVTFPVGGTVGTPGIQYQWSLDGGRTPSPLTALGSNNFIVIPTSGGIKTNLAAGTIVAGDFFTSSPTAPAPSSAELGTALDALSNTALPWKYVLIASPIDSSAFDMLETKFASMQSRGMWRKWIGSQRRVNVDESESAYKTAMDTIFSGKATIIGSLYSADGLIASPVTGRQYRRQTALTAGSLQASVSEEINIADIGLGPLKATAIKDSNGNPLSHDEFVTPGLDDSRYGTLRSWPGRPGVYVTRPRILCPLGSDFTIMPYRAVFDLYAETILAYLQERLNKPIIVDKNTGFIKESEAREIERGALVRLRSVLTAKPKVSDVQFSIARDDNLLSTKTMTTDGGIIPLAYPEFINLTLAFVNPALVAVAA